MKTTHVKQYKDIARLLMKYGRSDLLKTTGLDDVFAEDFEAGHETTADAGELAEDLEKLGPTFIKLGQLLSTRADLLPPAYLEALSKLQDDIEPFSFEEVQVIVSTELGIRLSKAFAEFDANPIATASLGQVHRAVLHDGREVAVKVQRPNIRQRVKEDLDAFEEIAGFLDKYTELSTQYQFKEILEEFKKTLVRELDYRQEAQHLNILRENLKQFRRILVPIPIHDYTTGRVLTMEYVQGKKVTAIGPLAQIELEGESLAEELFQAYLKQMLVDGFFHADPHPGNVFITDDRRIALIDLGMIGRLTPRLQEQSLQFMLAVSEGRAEEAAKFALKIGTPGPQFDEYVFQKTVSDLVMQNQDLELEKIKVGALVLEIARASNKCGLKVPQELLLVGKALLNLDQIGRVLDPQFNPNAAIRKNTAELARQRMLKSISPGNLVSTSIEIKDFLERLPGRINQLLDAASNNSLKIKVDAIDEEQLIEGLQKIANRITTGLVLAALIIGAAMLMRVETSFKILGYPGLAILLFLVAAIGGGFLIFNTLWQDRKTKKKLHTK